MLRAAPVVLGILLSFAPFGWASPPEFRPALTPQLAALSGVRLFVRVNDSSECPLPKQDLEAETRRALHMANIQTLDGFDPTQPDWPILEVSISSFGMPKVCSFYLGILLRANVNGAVVEGNHYYEYEEIWDVKDGGIGPARFLGPHVLGLLRRRLVEMMRDIEKAQTLFPEF